MNGIVHPCSHPEDRPPPSTEEEMMLAIFKYTDRVVNMVRPRKLLLIAVGTFNATMSEDLESVYSLRSAISSTEIPNSSGRGERGGRISFTVHRISITKHANRSLQTALLLVRR